MTADLADIQLEPSAAGTPGWYRASVPFPPGTLTAPGPLAACSLDGQHAKALQSRALAKWPDDSVRWLEVMGTCDQEGTISLRQGAGDMPDTSAWIRQQGDTLELGNDELSVALSATEACPLAWIRQQGQTLTAPEALTLGLRSSKAEQARFEVGDRRLTVRQEGPVRAVGEVSGWLVDDAGQRLFRYRLRVAVVAGQESVSMSFCLSHEVPACPSYTIHELQLKTHWQSAEAQRHHVFHPNHTLLCRPREIVTERPIELRASTDFARVHVSDISVFGEQEPWPAFMPETENHTEPYLGLKLANGWVTAAPRDFSALCPKALTVGDNSLSLHLQPAWAQPLWWPQGRSREITLDLLFSAGEDVPPTPDLRRQAAACQPGHGRLDPALYAETRSWGMDLMLPGNPPAPRRFSQYLRKLGTLPTILGMWDLGDTIDMGYTRTYAANHSTSAIADKSHPYFRSGNHAPLAEWSGQLTHEPVWANNEYDSILALAREWMRDRPPTEHWQRLRWFARHAIEVDFVCYSDSPLLHHGTPAHSADHQRATAYPSHLWAEGLLAYYCLSGDDDALDVAIKQGDFILRTFSEQKRRDTFWGFNRELGWALLHLAALTDLTGEARFREGMQELALALTRHDLDETMIRQMAQYPFGFASIALGVHATWAITQEAELADWLIQVSQRVAHEVVDNGIGALEHQMLLIYFTTAWQVSGDVQHLRPGLHVLEQLMDSKAWTDPCLETKPVAMLHRGLGTWLGPAWRAGLLEGLDFRFYSA